MASRRLALLGGSALAALTLAAGPARAADECGVVGVGGTASCNALSYPDGIAYVVDDLTINVGQAAMQPGAVTISTIGASRPAISNGFNASVAGDLRIYATGDITITTQGDFSSGIFQRADSTGMNPPATAIVISDANITTDGFQSGGIQSFINGSDTLASVTSTGTILTLQDRSTGVGVAALNAIAIVSGSITTHGDFSYGIAATAANMTVDSSAEIETYGVRAHGLRLSSNGPSTVVITGDVTTHGDQSVALLQSVSSPAVTLDIHSQLTTYGGNGAHGIRVAAFTGQATLNLHASATVTTQTAGSHGITSDHNYLSFTTAIDGLVVTNGDGAHGVRSLGFGYDADFFLTLGEGGRITTNGVAAHGIYAYNGCDYYGMGCGIQRLTVSGDVTASGADAFAISLAGIEDGVGGSVYANVTITESGDAIGGSGNGGGLDLDVPLAVVSISGNLSATSDLAIRSDGGVADIDSSGVVIGRLDLGGGADRFDNAAAGAWYARGGDSDFGDGADTLTNLGLISVIGDQSWFGIETLLNDGRLSLQEADAGAFNSHPGSFETLTIAGGFGGVGRLGLDTFLGDETSLSDVVVIEDAVSGTTLVEIANAGGPGALTAGSGIRVIDVSQGTTDGDDFLLAGPVMAGAFEYDLVLEDDGIWYLQSAAVAGEMLTPYVAPQLVALSGWHLQTGALHERLGEVRDQLAGPGAQTAALGRDDLQQASAFGGYGGGAHQGFWLRALGAGLELEPDGSLPIEQSSSGLQGGYDLGWRDSIRPGDLLLVGGSLGFGSHRGELRGADSEVELFGPTLGAYATWLSGGLHVDLVARADLLDAHLAAPLSGTDDSTRLTTLGGSIEIGYRAELGGLYLEPQVQLAYAHSWSGDLEDGSGAAIELDGAGSLRGRVGARVGGPLDLGGWQVKPYLEANLHHEFLGEAEVTVTGVTAASDLGGSFGSVGGGFETEALGEHLSLYLDVDYLFGENTRGVAGIVGARIAW